MATLSIQVSEQVRAFAAAEAAKQGLPDAAAYAARLLEETADQNGSKPPLTRFHATKTDLDALLRDQGVKPVKHFSEFVADFWPQDESTDDFLAALRRWRRGGESPDAKP